MQVQISLPSPSSKVRMNKLYVQDLNSAHCLPVLKEKPSPVVALNFFFIAPCVWHGTCTIIVCAMVECKVTY